MIFILKILKKIIHISAWVYKINWWEITTSSCQREHLWYNNPEKRTREELTRKVFNEWEGNTIEGSNHITDWIVVTNLAFSQVKWYLGPHTIYVAISVAVKLLALGPDHCSWLILSTTAGLPCFRAMSPDLKWG